MSRFHTTIVLALAVSAAPMPGIAQPASPSVVPAPRPMMPGGQIRDVITKLSPQGQAAFRKQWLSAEKDTMPLHRAAARAAEDRVFAAMAMEPFDAAELRHAYADQRAMHASHQKQRQDLLVSVMSQLGPADRKIVVDQLRALRDRAAQHFEPPHGP